MRIATVILLLGFAGASLATDQFPSTFVAKSKGTWTLWNDYVGGNVLPVLMEVVRNSEWGARAEAIYLLQRIGPSACSAVDAVTAAMADSDDSVREMAKETLRYISP